MPETVQLMARYENFEGFKDALRHLKEAHVPNYQAYGPINLNEIEDLMPVKGSPVRVWATIGAVVGLTSFWYMCVASSLLYNMITGGKPPVSNVPFVIPAYEGTILIGSLGAFIAVLVYAHMGEHEPPREYNPIFSQDVFGVLVVTTPDKREEITRLLRETGAQEINELS